MALEQIKVEDVVVGDQIGQPHLHAVWTVVGIDTTTDPTLHIFTLETIDTHTELAITRKDAFMNELDVFVIRTDT